MIRKPSAAYPVIPGSHRARATFCGGEFLARRERAAGILRRKNLGKKPNCGQYDTTVIELARGLGDIVAMWSSGQIGSAPKSDKPT
ncbi:hypothetical protein [Halosimplex halophilum]|uniref:hypothetical protein n=1 Tax=Halosimplex halophilum TaxID=2559572 RepID=UPI00107FC74B|nr:hypothetical protein [Halosimplex halophilum]